jgi:hypothetical protein
VQNRSVSSAGTPEGNGQPTPQASASFSSRCSPFAEQLTEYLELKKDGVLTEQEFTKLKHCTMEKQIQCEKEQTSYTYSPRLAWSDMVQQEEGLFRSSHNLGYELGLDVTNRPPQMSNEEVSRQLEPELDVHRSPRSSSRRTLESPTALLSELGREKLLSRARERAQRLSGARAEYSPSLEHATLRQRLNPLVTNFSGFSPALSPDYHLHDVPPHRSFVYSLHIN